MKRWLGLFATMVMLMALASCSTFSAFSSNATAPEKKAALCSDAQMGLELVRIGLRTAVTPAQRVYWSRYLKGVQAAVDVACVGQTD